MDQKPEETVVVQANPDESTLAPQKPGPKRHNPPHCARAMPQGGSRYARRLRSRIRDAAARDTTMRRQPVRTQGHAWSGYFDQTRTPSRHAKAAQRRKMGQ